MRELILVALVFNIWLLVFFESVRNIEHCNRSRSKREDGMYKNNILAYRPRRPTEQAPGEAHPDVSMGKRLKPKSRV